MSSKSPSDEVLSSFLSDSWDASSYADSQSLEQAIEEIRLALRKREHIERRSDEARSQFEAELAHEVLSPLGVILGTVELLDLDRKDPVSEHEHRKMLEAIKTACHRVASAVHRLPEAGPRAASLDSPPTPRPSEVASLLRQSDRVLVADDDPIGARVVMALLARAGFESDRVADGTAALQAVKTGRYAMVIMDCEMPKLGGCEATRLIRNLASPVSEIPVIALTASIQRKRQSECFESGMNGYLTKPVEYKVLRSTVRGYLRSAGEAEDGLDDHPSLNPGVLDSLCGSDHDRSQQLVERFAEEAEYIYRRILDAAEVKELTNVIAIAQRFRGSASVVGAERLVEATKRLEIAARAAADPGDLEQRIEVWGSALRQFRTAASRLGPSTPPPRPRKNGS